MEDTVSKIIKDSAAVKHAAIKQSAVELQEFLVGEHGLMRSPPYEVRSRCLETLRLALESKHGKLVNHALNGFQKLIWDKRFQSVFDTEFEENLLPIQMLKAVTSLQTYTEEVQRDILRILLRMASTYDQTMSARSIAMLLSLCLDAYCNSSTEAVRTAAQATANQSLQSFCIMLQSTDEELNDDSEDENDFNLLESVVEELNPILHFICGKLKTSLHDKSSVPLLLECVLSIFKNIKIDIYQNTDFINFLWQELCPLLVALLGSPKTDKNIVSSQKSNEGNEVGRGSGCLATAPSCQSAEAKTIYSIANELVRLVGSVEPLRPVLGSLFHRMLLYPPAQYRFYTLKSLKELMAQPELLLQFAAPPLHSTTNKDWMSLDLDLLKIAMDSLGQCCHSNDNNVCYASVGCVLSFLESLDEICAGEKISPEYIKSINNQFRTLESSDYKGDKSERWLKTKLNALITGREKHHMYTHGFGIRDNEASSSSADEAEEVVIENKSNNEAENGFKPETAATESPGTKSPTPDELEYVDCHESSENVAEVENSKVAVQNFAEQLENGTAEANAVMETDVVSEDNKDDMEVEEEDTVTNVEVIEDENFKQETTQHEGGMSISDAAFELEDEKEKVSPVNESAEETNEEAIEDENLKQETSQCEGEISVPDAASKLEDGKEKVSPVTESAEEALDYISSSASEDLSDEDNEDLDARMNELAEQEADRLKKVPQTLLGHEDAGKEERERVERLCLARMEFAQKERQNARHFVDKFQAFLPKLLSIRSSIEADQALQEFSSNYCEESWQAQQLIKEASTQDDDVSHITILNADGIYLALYSALLLNLKLIRSNYYKDPLDNVPLTEQQFIEEVHGSGVLVYLSATWLAELYQQVLANNLLEDSGYKPESLQNSAVINLLSGLLFGTDHWWVVNVSDVDGFGNSQPGAQQLADFRRLERALINNQSSPNVEAGRKFGRRVLTCCWETVLEVLSVLLNGTNSCGISSTIGFLLGTEGAKEEHRKTKDAITNSLDGLQRAAKLCNTLGLQSNCSAVFAQLANTSCPLIEDTIFPQSSKEYRHHLKKSILSNRNKILRLHASHILSMDVILSRGLELGSHSPDCWKYVFQCCLFVLQLENTYFSGHGNIQSVLSRSVRQPLNQNDRKESAHDFTASYDSCSNGFHDLSSMPGSVIPQKLDISDIIKRNGSFAQTSGIIRDQQLLEIIEALSQLVDRLFEEAASRLNLSALISFLVELCAASQVQLFTQNYTKFTSPSGHGSNLLLYHLGDVMMRCARGGRPLIHVMKSWSVVAPHFVEAACHKDRLISKKGVTTIHDIVSALLSSNSELPHFHFNEALFKPFENLLCLELCDTDVQEQIVSSICEFVEGCTTEIRSGWRPLFGALRAVRIPNLPAQSPSLEMEREHIRHLRVVLDVFEVFLGTDNVFVFAYAAVDCLLCLLKHVKGPADFQELPPDGNADLSDTPAVPLDMCLAALKFLERCSEMLSSMYTIPTCPVFNSAHRIHFYTEPNMVDPEIPFMEIIRFEDPDGPTEELDHESQNAKHSFEINNENLCHVDIKEFPVTLKSLDKHTGILHVWFLLLEGLAGALATCPRRYQSHTMESLFSMLQKLKDVPGPKFGIFCVNHLLLPMLQNWLRRTTKIYRGWDNFATNFKQCCGLATDLIVDYIRNMAETSDGELTKETGLHLMLQQLFLVLAECVAQPMEIISRLGCACIRHTVMSAGKYLTANLWDIVCVNLRKVIDVSLHSVKQLMVCFHPDSDNFYGDIGEVKVAARRDCTVQESERLRHLSHQVFLLDCQQAGNLILKSTCIEDDERTFTFLLFPPNHEQIEDLESVVIRVPFSSLVVGLLSHQILLQTLGSMLLQGTKHMLPTLMTLLPSDNPSSSCANSSGKPGFLSHLSTKQLQVLFGCLEESYQIASRFDSRPGLKFLVQKVAQTNVAANLYKQAGVSWTIHMVVFFELCLSSPEITLDFIKSSLIDNPSQPNHGSSSESVDHSSEETKSTKQFNGASAPEGLNEFVLLRGKFKDTCETYTEHTIDRDGLSSVVDKMSDQPIFFLATQADEMSDFLCNLKATESQATKAEDNQANYDSSDSEDLSAIHKDETKDKIYTLASEQTINSLISEYKKRKHQHAMPSKLKDKLNRRPRTTSQSKVSSDSSIPEEIVMQRRNSIMKDGEAQLQVFKQLIQSFLDLHQSLPNEQFQAFLPVFFPGVQYLVAYSSDGELRLSLSEWLQRLAVCCNFGV